MENNRMDMSTPDSKFLLRSNLQLFAVGADGTDPADLDDPTPVIDDSADPEPEDDDTGEIEVEFDDEDPSDPDEEDDDPEGEPAANPEPEPEPPAKPDKGKNPTAAAVIAERKRWQQKVKDLESKSALLDKVMRQSNIADAAQLERQLDAIASQRLQDQGVDPAMADQLVRQQRELERQQADLRKLKYDGEATVLKADPFYADLDDYREELEGIAERTGLTLKQAYNALHGDRRLQEREAEITARAKTNREKRDAKRVTTGPTAPAKQPASAKSLGLTQEQYEAAQHGVKRGIFKSVAEYAKYLRK